MKVKAAYQPAKFAWKIKRRQNAELLCLHGALVQKGVPEVLFESMRDVELRHADELHGRCCLLLQALARSAASHKGHCG